MKQTRRGFLATLAGLIFARKVPAAPAVPSLDDPWAAWLDQTKHEAAAGQAPVLVKYAGEMHVAPELLERVDQIDGMVRNEYERLYERLLERHRRYLGQ